MLWIHGPHGLYDNTRLPRERRHEPFTPRLPGLLMTHPSACAVALAGGGIGGIWAIVRSMPRWPDWALIPGSMLGILCILAMMFGLGILVVRVLEPVIGLMELDWNAEPVSSLGMPIALQRTCERLGYWTADDLARSVARGSFPWTEVAYAERMQIERAAHLWNAGAMARRPARRSSGRMRARRRVDDA
ncbi:MAG TPA: hypothetical protein VMM78_11985 [Thermomicrobiales bacterium]|nr:hypothetical protein [Thermomicrobiales bacterium]